MAIREQRAVRIREREQPEVFVDWGHWQFVHMDGSDWQMVPLARATVTDSQ